MHATELKPPPSLAGHWLWGSVDERRKDPLGFVTRLASLGDVAAFRLMWLRGVALNSAEAVKHVLVDNAQNYWKGKPMDFLKPVLGEGLFTAEGEFWKRNRRLAQPAFHRERLASLVQVMTEATQKSLDRMEHASPNAPFNFMSEMMALTMSVVGRALFTTDVSDASSDVGRALTYALEETNHRVLAFNPVAMRMPTRRNRLYKEAVQALDNVIFRVIGGRRKATGPSHDLLAMLMEAKDADTGEQMNDRQLRDEVMTLFLAGHETTAVSMSWLWALLAQHPEVTDKACAEIEAVLGQRPPTAADLPKLKYVSMCFDEALRLYPPAWILIRESYGPDVICGYAIPKETMIVVNPYVLHRSPKYWDAPEQFSPERFSPEQSASRPRYAFLPFGAGQRMCIGNNFAMMEAQVITTMLLQRFRPRLASGFPIPDPQVTLRPKGGVHVTLERAMPQSRPAVG